MRRRQAMRWQYIELLVMLCDQLTKCMLHDLLNIQNKIHVLPHLNFTMAHNHGAAFGILAQAGGWQRWFFVAVALVVIAIATIWMQRLKPDDNLTGVGIALITGGALGNLIDRIRFGYVIDFIDFYIGSWHWFTFNIADIAICVGALFIILKSFSTKPN
jgi:signal peptidase II